MIDKRPIRFSTLLNLIRGDKPFFLLGAIFTCLSIFIMFPALTVIVLSINAPFNKYDFKAIEKNGIQITANATGVQTLYNENINGQHPKVISYFYYLDGQTYTDQFETLDLGDLPLNAKNEIKIKVYNGQSIIEGLKPFSFPGYVLYIIPLIFLLLGIPFLLIGLGSFRKRLKLYKYGIVKEASIVAMKPVLPQGKNRFKPFVLVDYYFMGTNGQKITDKSSTHDMTFLTTKKAGNKVKIFVLEDDERKSCLVPLKEAEKNGWVV